MPLQFLTQHSLAAVHWEIILFSIGLEGNNLDSLKWEEEQNKEAASSPVMGFVFDTARLARSIRQSQMF